MTRSASVLVLNYNGRHLLEECLPGLLHAVRRAGPGHAVHVVDNASTDGSREFLRREFPGVGVVEIAENRFIFAYNEAADRVEQDILVLLNNDIAVHEDFLPPLLEPFSDPQVFAVGARILEWDRRTPSAGRRRGELRRGMFLHHDAGGAAGGTPPTLFAPGGAGAFDRRKFLEIGGLDPLYRPYYYDDVDLSYRAWKRGWKVLYQPRSLLYHRVQATIARLHTAAEIETLDRKNGLLFFWKNITDPGPFLLHHLLLPGRALKALLLLRLQFLRALGLALRQWPEARAARRRLRPFLRRSDREVLALCGAGEEVE
ncbi:MAG: glycosyltransferase family 2 protein [Acidobacteria bacterium]|nr:glycosyltransferase family 2 protein [Acidobacteriota bacterium]